MILYTRYQCSACENVKAYLNDQGKNYKVVNIQEDYEAASKLVQDGIRRVPVLELADGERLIGAEAIRDHV